MKLSNKILLGGFLTPIVLILGFIIYMSLNSTDDPNFQVGQVDSDSAWSWQYRTNRNF